MRRLPIALAAVGLVIFVALSPGCRPTNASRAATTSSIRAYFSPRGHCTEAVVEAIDSAKQRILVQAYSFTSAPIAKALVDAYGRGVRVTAILDKSQRTEKYSEADFLAHAGIATYIDAKHAIAHNKIMLIDDDTIITGSFNFTKAAEEQNAENLLVIRGHPELFEEYEKNFEKHLEHSEKYGGGEEGEVRIQNSEVRMESFEANEQRKSEGRNDPLAV